MPEGDTIHRTAVALRTAVLGKPLTAFEAPRLVGIHPSIGAVVERVESRGKHLEIGFDDGVVLHTHMRMTGSWHLYRAGEQWRKSARQARVILEVPGWQAVCFSAPVVRTYRAKEFLPNPSIAALGPDLCQADVDLNAAVARIDQYVTPDTSVAEMLLDQRIACGVGNVYKSEVLWVCELHPGTPVGALLPEQRRVLLATAASLLQANLHRPNRITVPGVPGGQAVYGRHAKPCFRCGTPIAVAKHGEQARVTYWCPSCQLRLEPEPPDDGEDMWPEAADWSDDETGMGEEHWASEQGREHLEAEPVDAVDEPDADGWQDDDVSFRPSSFDRSTGSGWANPPPDDRGVTPPIDPMLARSREQ